MEPGRIVMSFSGNLFLLILLFLIAADLLTAVVLHVYRYLLDEDIVIPGGEDKSEDRPISERLLDDGALIR